MFENNDRPGEITRNYGIAFFDNCFMLLRLRACLLRRLGAIKIMLELEKKTSSFQNKQNHKFNL